MRRTFLDTFGRVSAVNPALLRNMFKTLTGDVSSAANTHEAEIDARLAQFIDDEDETLVWDLRVNNGRPETYLPFLERCQQYLASCVETSVSDRRHDDVIEGEVVTHMATALNATDFYDQVIKTCPPDIAIPSLQWLRWQFWPRRPGSAASKRYTGRIRVKYMIMARQMRENHIDQYYASAMFRYQKEFCVRFHNYTSLICQDDKHTIKVGEPGLPVSAVERGKQVLVAKDQTFEVADHDFTKFSLSPSVSFKVEIPDSMMGSFYRGVVYVGLKENAFEASSCLRHLAEYSATVPRDNPIECHYHDGGPDHNVRHMRNKLANIAYFLDRNLDALSSVQTPPKHSWKNPAERCMSILNIGLQGVGLMRQKTASCEDKLKNAGNLGAIRNLESILPQIRQEVLDAVQPVKDLLGDVFSRLKLKDEPLRPFQAASRDDISALAQTLTRIDPDFDASVLTDSKKTVKPGRLILDFIKKHCLERHYMFSIKRCGDADCVCGKPSLPEEIFHDLHHLPDPTASPTEADKYMNFQEIYGKKHTDEELFLPSKIHRRGEKNHGMPFPPSSQYAKNTKSVIQCDECQRWRCLYSKKALKRDDRDQLQREMDTLIYSCGTSFSDLDELPDDSVLNRVFMSKKLTCMSPMEIPYYASFPEEPLCFECGTDDNLCDYDAKKNYPLCEGCRAAGKTFNERRTKAFAARETGGTL
ncbi:PREDICTED: uncharacterized protein LOC106814419 [Priapulus caudatus]|uniref:Uncharacterized protein LOC106814419 n=1 Tax=Priapulus caudatus TaxID=37621 RepID=A0ABM1EPU8_PRICU|nr:PREDICTED: uncharacterized protein LOC106814419 [Priapulus caudatus]